MEIKDYRTLFLLMLCSIWNSNYASFDATVSHKLYKASTRNKPLVSEQKKPKAAIDLNKVHGAKKLIQAQCWGDSVQNIIQIVDCFPACLKRSIIDYCGNDEQCLRDISRCGTVRSPNESYYPIVALIFAQDRTYVQAVFDRCTEKEYQENKQANPKYQASGIQQYWIGNKSPSPSFGNGTQLDRYGDKSEGEIRSIAEFWNTIRDGGYRTRRFRPLDPAFVDYDGTLYRIQDRVVGISDDGFLKAQVEYHEGRDRAPKELSAQYPGKILLARGFFGAGTLRISVWVNMTELLKCILLTPNFLEIGQSEDSSCVIS